MTEWCDISLICWITEQHGGIEIHQVQRTPFIEQYVARLQIAVQDTADVDMRKPVGELY